MTILGTTMAWLTKSRSGLQSGSCLHLDHTQHENYWPLTRTQDIESQLQELKLQREKQKKVKKERHSLNKQSERATYSGVS